MRPRRVLAAAAVAALLSTPTVLQAHAGTAGATPSASSSSSGVDDLEGVVLTEAGILAVMGAPAGTTADGDVWAASATGYASVASDDLPEGTTGGLGGPAVVADTLAELTAYAVQDGPLVVLVTGSIEVEPFGSQIEVGSDKTIVGVGDTAEIVGGGFFLDGSSNVVLRNLLVRDSYVAGDWDGKSADNDNDGVRMDTADHVWLDHLTIERAGDGLVDVRKDSDAVTLSWNVLRDHDKAVGVGWTDNVVTRITMHHNLFSNTYQRNASIDNTASAHVYDNYFHGQALYGTMSRGAASVLAESNYYEDGEDALVAKDEASVLESRDNLFSNIKGLKEDVGTAVDPATAYDYAVDAAADVPGLVAAGAGSLADDPEVGGTVTVALDGSGDFASVGAAVAAAERADHPVTIEIAPGTYREVVRVWDDMPAGLTLRGTGEDASEVVLTYENASGSETFYGETYGSSGSPTLGVLASDVTLAGLTVVNAYDEAANGYSQALALRTVGDRIVLEDVRLLGNQDTWMADSPDVATASRVYVTDSYVEGDVDFIYGRATVVVEDSTIRSLDRDATVNGYVTAASTVTGNPYGFLFTGCTFVSDAADGTVYLGRPWHPSSNPDTDPAVTVRDSWLGGHVTTPAWTDMSGYSWLEAEFYEYGNTGPGAATGDGRPQLTDEQAVGATREAYLAGDDGWAPWEG